MLTRVKSSILAAATALALTVGASAANAEAKTINGHWLLPDNSILVISGSDWSHPSRGAATIRRLAGNSIEVKYHASQGTGCKYRVSTTAGGDVLVLETADSTQSLEFCPSGRFPRRD